jgi:hypothetical protein
MRSKIKRESGEDSSIREDPLKISPNQRAISVQEEAGSFQTTISGRATWRIVVEVFRHFVVRGVLKCCKS